MLGILVIFKGFFLVFLVPCSAAVSQQVLRAGLRLMALHSALSWSLAEGLRFTGPPASMLGVSAPHPVNDILLKP